MNLRRVWAIMLRHLYNFRRNADRLVDAFYWPTIDVILWGLTIAALSQFNDQSSQQWVESIVFALLLWYFVWRSQGDITVSILEEIWSENITNLFASPLQLKEWMVALCALGTVKLSFTIALETVVIALLYHVSFFSLGWYLVPFTAILLVMGWGCGFVLGGLFLRYGTSVQTLAWSGVTLLMPLSAVFYPLATMPEWVQTISRLIPATYVFEMLRLVISGGTPQLSYLLPAVILDILLLVGGAIFFVSSFKVTQSKGLAHLK